MSTSLQDLLDDSFDRIAGLVETVTDRLNADVATFRPDPGANTIAWLVWHQSRVLDDHVADLAGTPQAWTACGWHQRLGLPFEARDIGFGHDAGQVATVDVSPEQLRGYHADVHTLVTSYVATLDDGELARIVDTRWDPPVTASARLVSVIGDCLQHLGQAAYVRGIAERR